MNARHGHSATQPRSNRLHLTFAYRTHQRTLALPRFAAFIIFLLVPFVSVSYLGATYYFIFHDDVLARLMQHQADMQYVYENQISTLRHDVANADQRADGAAADFSARLRVLSQRADQIESRTALIATFANHEKQMHLPAGSDDGVAGVDLTPTGTISAGPAPTVTRPHEDGKPHPAGFDLRLQDSAHQRPLPFSSSDEMQRDGAPAVAPADLERRLLARDDRIDTTDLTLLGSLEQPADHLTRDVRETLAAVGLSANRFRPHVRAEREGGTDVGGPFVPLPILSDGSPFATAAAKLENALATADELKSVLPHLPLRAPLTGELEVTSPFGPRIDPFLGRPALHTGVDLRGGYGDAIHATAPGRVTFAGNMGGYGNLVEVDNGNGLATRYAHLSSIDVSLGETVATGTIVGHIGDTGRATGPHLHYEVRIDGAPVDPERFLRAGLMLQSGTAL